MESSILLEEDIQSVRGFIAGLAPNSSMVDFEEKILLTSIKATSRIWKQDDQIVGFAFVDDYDNVCFDTTTEFELIDRLETEIIDWGIACIKKRISATGKTHTLDSSSSSDDHHRIGVLKEHGFFLEQVRSLKYSRSLNEPVAEYPLPDGFHIRPTKGSQEIKQLVALHRAAFGSEKMTEEYRQAMMNTSQYNPEMDLVVVAPNNDLAAFCVCGFDDLDKKTGYTDPVGTHPAYQRLGLAKAVISSGLAALKNAAVFTVELGTSSENIAMQKLASSLGFSCISEKLWFSKTVN